LTYPNFWLISINDDFQERCRSIYIIVIIKYIKTLSDHVLFIMGRQQTRGF